MAFKFNDGDGAIICDLCRIILVTPAREQDFSQAPYFTPKGNAYCTMDCLLQDGRPNDPDAPDLGTMDDDGFRPEPSYDPDEDEDGIFPSDGWPFGTY